MSSHVAIVAIFRDRRVFETGNTMTFKDWPPSKEWLGLLDPKSVEFFQRIETPVDHPSN